MMDLTRERFGKLVVVREVKKRANERMWLCKCECGKKIVIYKSNLRRGNTKSCGCLRGESHGLANTRLCSVWASMKTRCYNKNRKHYKNYGGRGITICDEWRNSFQSFYDWAMSHGYSDELQIDRVNNDGNYEPSNCRFVTNRENVLNQRLLKSSNTSGYCGVSFHKNNNKWRAYIQMHKKMISLGLYETRGSAAIARNNYIIENDLQDDYKIQRIKEEEML